jgi:hypothetical protein
MKHGARGFTKFHTLHKIEMKNRNLHIAIDIYSFECHEKPN